MNHLRTRRVLEWGFVLGVVIGCWELLAAMSPGLIPHSWEIFASTVQLLADESYRKDIVMTILRTFASFGIALVVGWPVGAAIGSITWMNRIFSGPLDFLRSIPAFVLLPLFMVFLNTGESSRIAMAAFGAGLVMVANTAFGVARVASLRGEVVRVYGGRLPRRLEVIFLEALPQSLDGARLGLSLALILSIVGEIMLGATHALGTRVNDSLSSFDLSRMYALILIIGLIGYLINVAARVTSNRIGWYGKDL